MCKQYMMKILGQAEQKKELSKKERYKKWRESVDETNHCLTLFKNLTKYLIEMTTHTGTCTSAPHSRPTLSLLQK